MDIATWVVEKIADPLLNAAGGEICYLFEYDKNIENVDKLAKKLGDLKERVQGQVDAAWRKGEVIEDDVRSWFENVDAETSGVRKLLEDEDKAADKRCLGGWCINFCSRYHFSKEAKQKTDAIAELHEEGCKFQTVSHPALPPGIEASSSRGFSTFGTRASATKQIMDALMDENTHIIGICGMGGVGKTTLIKEIGKRAKERELFGEVVMAVVSQTPSVTNIQKEIAGMLGQSLDSDGNEWLGALSLGKTIRMHKRILVILDDVWKRLDLEAVGIPLGEYHMGCKVLLTSRSEEVCNQMGVQKIVAINVLPKPEAWALFREMAGEAVDSSDLNRIARDVADECGGVPLVIVTIARALKNKKESVWAHAAQQLKKSNPKHIYGLQTQVYAKLELSFNYLESEEAKSFFLLCCLFPEDYNIPVEDLTRYATGLRMFQDVSTIEEARGRACSVVSTLTASFMLLDGYKEGFVKMHDVLRDVAIYISSKDKKYKFKVMSGGRDWPHEHTFENYSAISLISNDIHELPGELQCPKLQTLRLQCNSDQLQIPIDFFQGLKDQLRILDTSGSLFRSFPQSLQLLSTLRTLHITSCKLLGDISIIGRLDNLEILSFCGSEVDEIPQDIGQLTHLRLLDLTDCNKLIKIVPGVIPNLRKLEELYLPEYFRIADINLVELKSLSRLARLRIFIPVNLLHIDLHVRKLTSFNITIGIPNRAIGQAYEPNSYVCVRSSRISYDGTLPLLSDWAKLLLKKTKHLLLHELKNLKNIFSELNEEGFNELKSLQLNYCSEMEYLVNTTEWTPQVAFRSLEVLWMQCLNSFIEICPGRPSEQSFCNVQQINVLMCRDMLRLVSSSLLLRLRNLKKVTVYLCSSLVYVFELEEHVVEEGLLSKLKEIDLRYLDKMTHVWKDGPHQFISLCNLEVIRLIKCEKLRKLFSPMLLQGLVRLKYLDISLCHSLEEIFGHEEEDTEIVVCKNDPRRVTCFRSLTNVSVSYCRNLRHIFSNTSILHGDLEKLEKLYVHSCTALQEIVEFEEGEQEAASVEKIVFPCLHSIALVKLDNLKSFCTGHYNTIAWPSLETLEITCCPKMKTFGCGVQVTPKLKKLQQGYRAKEIRMDGDLNATVAQQIFRGKASAPEESPTHPSP